MTNYSEEIQRLANLIQGIADEVHNLHFKTQLENIAETLENVGQEYCDEEFRKMEINEMDNNYSQDDQLPKGGLRQGGEYSLSMPSSHPGILRDSDEVRT